MSGPRAIPDRYELKYLVPESSVPALRAALAPYCALDAHSAAAAGRQYVISSLYLDTAQRDLYRVSREGRPERFKVRLRRYGDGEAVFLEVKHKRGGLVRKSRAKAGADFAAALSSPAAPDASAAEQDFRRRVARFDLGPTLLVRYEREAYSSTVDAYARVTLDRRIACQPAQGWDLRGDPSRFRAIDDAGTMGSIRGAVLLELKSTVEVPRWMVALAQRLELRRAGFSKYCNGLERCFASLSPQLDAVSRFAQG